MPDALILGATLALAAAPYLAWPSRWNVLAHLGVAFWVVAFFVPVAVVGVTEAHPQPVVERLSWVLAWGAGAYVLGVILGSSISPARPHGIFARLQSWNFADTDPVARRTLAVGFVAILLLAVALLWMGFVPMFADDPFAAKFFRGEYGEAYRPVAPLYRAASGVLTVLLPLLLVYGVSAARGWRWRIGFVFGFLLMLGTLQREPAVTGVLLVLGVWLASRRRSGVFFLIAVAAYTAGALYYTVLSELSIIQTVDTGAQTFSETVALSAPDVADVLWFLGRWESYNEPLTFGRTFFGGVVPGNFQWNPGVWSLTLGNPNVDLESISSGCLRLPLPVWGLSSFGAVGVVAVPFLSGAFAGFLAKSVARVMPHLNSLIARLWAVVLYSAYWALLVEYVTVGYLTLVQFVVVYWACRGFRPPHQDLASPPHTRGTSSDHDPGRGGPPGARRLG